MPLHHVHEAYTNPASLVQTLIGLGLGGVVMPGALAWDSYPRAAGPVNVVPNATTETDGAAATLIAAAAITVPYYVTHLVFASAAAGEFQLRLKLQNSTPTIFRILRACNNRTTGPNGAIQSLSFPPIPIAASLGTQAIIATAPGAGPTQQAYVTTLLQSRVISVPELLAVAPRSNGDIFPASSEIEGAIAATLDTVAWAYGNYVEVTPGLPVPALVTAVWGQISRSVASVQATFAAGASGGEVDWGTFAWPVPAGADDGGARHNLAPFPFYLPANTRVAVRARSAGTVSVEFQTSLEYVPVPIR